MKRGRTFMSTGPLLQLEVEGRGPGDEIDLARGAPATLHVKAEVLAIAPIDSLQIVVNGVAVQTVAARDPAFQQMEVTPNRSQRSIR